MLNRRSLFVTGAFMLLVNATVLLTLPGVALAQREEIVVTARKKEESLQDVPLSIAAFSGEQMRQRGIQNNYDLARFTPNFSTQKQVGRTLDRPTIRGMAGPSSRGEPNASYFVDGMFVSGSVSTATTASMERAEILRGPQSALFGRATFAGAVNYITRSPTDEWASEVNTRVGTSEDYQVGGWVSGPLVSDLLGLLVSASWDHYGGQWRNQLEPNMAFVPDAPTNVFDGQNTEGDSTRLGREETVDILTKLRFTPFDSTEVNLKYNFTRGDDGHFPNNAFFDLNCFLPDDPAEPWFDTSPGAFCGEVKIDNTFNRKNIPDIKNGLRTNSQFAGTLPIDATISDPTVPGQSRDTHRVLGEWIQDIGDWSSTLKAAYTRDDFNAAYDLDHTEARAVWGLFGFVSKEDREDYSFEYLVASPEDRPVRGRLGVYYYHYENEFIQHSSTGPFAVFSTPPGTRFGDPRMDETENQSVFGGLAFDLADNWTLEFEARWAKDEKSIESGQLSEVILQSFNTDFPDDFSPLSSPVRDRLSFTSFTPRVILRWAATDDINVYGLVAKGTKPGGFNSEFYRSDVPAEFPEFVKTCELGDELTIFPMGSQFRDCDPDLKDLLTFAEEEQWTYEGGIKSTWFEQRLLANLSFFYIDWINQGLFLVIDLPQIGTGAATTTTVVSNAGATQVIGLELETSYFVNDNLSVFLTYGYNDGEFKKGKSPEWADISGTDGNIAGKETPHSPNHSVVLGFDAKSQLTANAEGFIRADFSYESEKWRSVSNTGYLGERKLVNLRTGLESDRWSLTFYIRNLLDDDTPTAVLDFVNFGQPAWPNGELRNMAALNPALGRDAGLEFQMRFGD